VKQEKVISDEIVLDFGNINKYTDPEDSSLFKTIVLTVYSNTTWILLAKPSSSDSFFNNLFTDDSTPLSYSVKTKGTHDNFRFHPFIQDDYIIIASGKKTPSEGQEVEINLRINKGESVNPGEHTANIDFVLLTKERYIQKLENLDNKYFPRRSLVDSEVVY
jgi:hypothetical protein